MKRLLLAAFAVSFFILLCGCPQTAPPTKPSQTTLLDAYKGGDEVKVTIVYFMNPRCPVKVVEYLRGVQNFSDGTVKLFEVNGDIDRDAKNAYSIRAYPTTLFFKGNKLERRIEGPEIDFEQAKKMAAELGATIKGLEGAAPAEQPEEATEEETEQPGEGG